MISQSQHKLNTAYNLLITKLVLWHGLYNRMKADKEQGYNPIKNRDKMLSYQEQAFNMMQLMDLSDLSTYKSYYPLINDKELIDLFKDTVQ